MGDVSKNSIWEQPPLGQRKWQTLASSRFKRVYSPHSPERARAEQACKTMTTTQLLATLKSGLKARGKKSWTDAEVHAFVDGLGTEVNNFIAFWGKPSPTAAAFAVYIWTSLESALKGREFCFWLCTILREDAMTSGLRACTG